MAADKTNLVTLQPNHFLGVHRTDACRILFGDLETRCSDPRGVHPAPAITSPVVTPLRVVAAT